MYRYMYLPLYMQHISIFFFFFGWVIKLPWWVTFQLLLTRVWVKIFIIRPSSDGTYYGMVMSVRPSGSPSASFPHLSPTCFDILSWNFAYDFVLLYYRSSLSVVNFRQFLWELCPFCNLQYWKYTVFRTLLLHALTYWAEILHMSWYDFGLLYYRSSSSVVTLRQFLWELCPFWNLQYWKYTVFRTFLLHAMTYWAQILHMTLLYCTTDQDRESSISVKFCASYAPFVTYNTGNTQFSALFSYMLWHIQLKFCTWLCYTVLCTDQVSVLSICVNFCGSYAPFGT